MVFVSPAGAGPVAASRNTALVNLSSFNPINLAPDWWLDTPQITGLSNGDGVTSFTDFSGNGRNFTGAGTHTKYVTGAQNGLPVVRNDITAGTSLLVGPGTMANYITASDYCMWVAGRVASAPSSGSPAYDNAAFLSDGAADVANAIFVEANGHVGAFGYDGASREARVAAAIGSFNYFIVQHTGGNLTISVNGAAPVSVACGNTALTFTPHLFCNYAEVAFMTGDIGEIGGRKSSLSATEFTSLSNYLNSKWAP